MVEPAIKVEKLGKRYRLFHQAGARGGSVQYRRLSDALHNLLRQPFQARRDNCAEDFYALRDVSFTVQPGEVVGIIGKNGAGKSTLLKILSRITPPSSGRVELNGRVVSLLEVGTGFHPELTGRENIFLNGAILGMTRAEIERKFDEIVSFAEVEKFLDTPVKHYSSGMYVRLAFSVAAHLEPEILIIDEVLAVGDVAFQNKCLAKMKDVASDRGRTVLFVSHNMSAVLALCDRCIMLGGGAVVADGTPSEIVQCYFARSARQQARVDLVEKKRPYGGRNKVRFVAVELTQGSADGVWQVPFAQDLTIALTAEASDSVEGVVLGVALSASSGVEVTSSRTPRTLAPASIGKGRCVFTVQYIDMRLSPGVYRLSCELRSDHGTEDYIADAADLEIIVSEEAAQLGVADLRGMIIPRVKYGFEFSASRCGV